MRRHGLVIVQCTDCVVEVSRWKEYGIGTLHYNWPMSVHASYGRPSEHTLQHVTVPIRNIYRRSQQIDIYLLTYLLTYTWAGHRHMTDVQIHQASWSQHQLASAPTATMACCSWRLIAARNRMCFRRCAYTNRLSLCMQYKWTSQDILRHIMCVTVKTTTTGLLNECSLISRCWLIFTFTMPPAI